MITLLCGDEGYLVDRAATALIDGLRASVTVAFNFEDVQADTLSVEAFSEAVSILPFLDAGRVLVLRDWGVLSGKRDRGGAAERAAETIGNLPDTTHLVLVLHGTPPAANPIFKSLLALQKTRQATIERFDAPRKADRAGWVRRLAEQRGLTIIPGAVRLLLERTPPDLRLLDQEIAKLSLFVFPGTRIDEAAVQALTSQSREEEIYALSDAFGSARPGEAAAVLRSLLDSGREPTYVLYTLVQHWRRLLHARAARDEHVELSELQARLGDHPFVVEKAYRQAADYSLGELERGFHELLRIEEQIKLGELDGRLALEGFVLAQSLS
jgi:DNA polymerase-3 subunit delta